MDNFIAIVFVCVSADRWKLFCIYSLCVESIAKGNVYKNSFSDSHSDLQITILMNYRVELKIVCEKSTSLTQKTMMLIQNNALDLLLHWTFNYMSDSISNNKIYVLKLKKKFQFAMVNREKSMKSAETCENWKYFIFDMFFIWRAISSFSS